MIIEIDTKTLVDEKLTPTQHFVLQLISLGQHKYLKSWYESLNDDHSIMSELRRLIDMEFILSLNTSDEVIDFTKLFLLPRSIKLLGADRDWFQELVNIYPVKAIRSDGIKDYLRTDQERCRNIYNRKINGNLKKHEHVLDLLKYELQVRTNEGSMSYMKRLPKWLASEEWKVFEERRENEGDTKDEGGTYGTDLV
jgi:hypothetical protein